MSHEARAAVADRLYDDYIAGLKKPAGEQAAPPVAAPPAVPAEPVDSSIAPNQPAAEHRYEVLQGKYNAEVPRLVSEARTARQELADAKAEIARLKAPPVVKPKLLRDEEVTEYGEGLIDVIRRTSQEELAAKDTEIDALNERLNRLERGQAQGGEDSYQSRLTAQVPDWQIVNDDPLFHKWLNEADDFTGKPRQLLLDAEHGARNPDSVARIFKAFKATAVAAVSRQQRSLENHVVPDGNGDGEPPKEGQAKVWQRSEIAAHYDAVRRGTVTDKRAAEIDLEITTAVAERRVR